MPTWTFPQAAVQESKARWQSADGRRLFRLRFPRRELIYRVSDSLGNVAVNLFGFALGDHGIFCRRVAFRRVGGYPEVPILEDAEIFAAATRGSDGAVGRGDRRSNPRTFEATDVIGRQRLYFSILALYVLGVPIRILNRIYRRCSRTRFADRRDGRVSARRSLKSQAQLSLGSGPAENVPKSEITGSEDCDHDRWRDRQEPENWANVSELKCRSHTGPQGDEENATASDSKMRKYRSS